MYKWEEWLTHELSCPCSDRQAGAMGREQPHEVLQEEMRSPASGEEQSLDQYTLETNQLKSSSVKNLRLLEDNQLTTSQQCTLMVKKANSSLGCVPSGADNRLRRVTPSLGTGETSPEHQGQCWAPQHRRGGRASTAPDRRDDDRAGPSDELGGAEGAGSAETKPSTNATAQMSNISAMFSQFQTT